MIAHQPWPEQLAGTPSVAVIERAIKNRRLSHSLLLTGDDPQLLDNIASAIADRLLNTPESTKHFLPQQHPDLFHLRPKGKMRQIAAGTEQNYPGSTRELIDNVQKSSSASAQKVAIIHECDRFHPSAANIFLKTLEEPPPNTTLLLTTTNPHSLLPTIRSRCLLFRFPSQNTTPPPDGWEAWLADYQTWLAQLTAGITTKAAATDAIMTLYGLLARFTNILDTATDKLLGKQSPDEDDDPDDNENPREENTGKDTPILDKTELIAQKAGHTNALRLRLFSEIAAATRNHALPAIERNNATSRRALVAAIEKLEHNTALLRANLNEIAALENFLLTSLRLWTAK